MPKEPEDYNHVPLASYRRSYVSKEAHEKAIAAKDAEIERLRRYLFDLQWKPEDYTDDGERQSVGIKPYVDFKRHDVEQLIKCCDARFQGAKERAQTKAESLESKCAKMREILGEIRRNETAMSFAMGPDMCRKIDAILESEEA